MWNHIHGHDDVAERFRQSVAAGRLATTYLFVGPPGIGKRTFALELAKALLCQQNRPGELVACGTCESCRLFGAGSHPDLLLVSRPEGKSTIPVELFIGPKEKRMREGLCHDIGLRPLVGSRRVAIIDDADFLNQEGANALLKTLEEPPPGSVLILIGSSPARQLPTIRSRCQLIRFNPLPESTIAALLQQGEAPLAPDEAAALAHLSGGSLAKALELADAELRAFRRKLFQTFSAGAPDGVQLAAEVTALVDKAGKEAPPRRARLRQVIGFVIEYYRAAMRTSAGSAPQEDDPDLRAALSRAPGSRPPEAVITMLERCLDALDEIDRNANQATLIECWVDDLIRTGAST
jgi:DNA polymerase-3 subunit delta'